MSEIASKLLLAGISNMSAACVTNPIDVVKVRMQLEGQYAKEHVPLSSRKYNGFLRGGLRMIQEEGFLSLYKGLPASLAREGSYSAIRLGLYDIAKEVLGETDPNTTPLYKKIAAGSITGALGSAIANPTDLVKIRMQACNLNPQIYISCMKKEFRLIHKAEGFPGLWRGVGATTQRAALLTATQIPSYDHSKHYLLKNDYMKEGMKLHALSSMFAGFMTATVTSPIDVIKTRIMAENCNNAKKMGTIEIFTVIIKTEGVRGLYKGWFPNWMRIGPHTIVALMIFEQLRANIGIRPV